MAESESKWTVIAKLLESFHIIVTILGIAIVLIAILGGVAYKTLIPPIDIAPRCILGVFGLAVVVLGLYLMRSSPGTRLPNAKDFGVVILQPQRGDRVTSVDVRGTIKKKPPTGYTLWVFRVYDDQRFWHCRQCVINEAGDEWTANGCGIGGRGGDSREFSVNLVGPDGSALLSYVDSVTNRFNDLRNNGKIDSYPPRIWARTRDMIECKRVAVVRD